MKERNVLVFLELNFFYGHVNEGTSFDLNEYWKLPNESFINSRASLGFSYPHQENHRFLVVYSTFSLFSSS